MFANLQVSRDPSSGLMAQIGMSFVQFGFLTKQKCSWLIQKPQLVHNHQQFQSNSDDVSSSDYRASNDRMYCTIRTEGYGKKQPQTPPPPSASAVGPDKWKSEGARSLLQRISHYVRIEFLEGFSRMRTGSFMQQHNTSTLLDSLLWIAGCSLSVNIYL
jgi:hypothetical protein